MAAETAVLQPTKVLALQNEPDVLAAYWVCKCRGKQLYTMNLRYWQSTRRAIASVVVNKDIPNKHSVNCIICILNMPVLDVVKNTCRQCAKDKCNHSEDIKLPSVKKEQADLNSNDDNFAL